VAIKKQIFENDFLKEAFASFFLKAFYKRTTADMSL